MDSSAVTTYNNGMSPTIYNSLERIEKADNALLAEYEETEHQEENIGPLSKIITKIENIKYRQEVRKQIVERGLAGRSTFVHAELVIFDKDSDNPMEYFINIKQVRVRGKYYQIRSFAKFCSSFLGLEAETKK